MPPLLLNAPTFTSQLSNATSPPDMALATDLSYVMAGIDAAVGIYRATNGALAYGPYTADSFFQPIRHANDTFSDPQMNYDVMRDRWIVTYLEWTPGGLSYLDIAVSTSNSPTQPAPGAQYHEFQIPTTFLGSDTACDYQTLGIEYYSLTVTCVEFDTSNVFKGNTTIVLDKNSLLSSNTATYYTFNNAVNTSLNTCSGPCPDFRLSPAIEDGVQDGEFIVATDTGYGVTSSNLTLCALMNLNNVSTTAPTLTCGLNNLGVSYADPLPAQQFGGHPDFTVGLGTKQIYYKAGRLFVSFTSAFTSQDGAGDAPVWVEVQPHLSTLASHSPQWVHGALIAQASTFFFIARAYSYNPTLMGTDEGDMLLTFNQTNPTPNHTSNSLIIWTGRKATDAPNTMGQDAGTFSYKSFGAIGSEYVAASHWSDYAACAVPLNSVTRGKVWCAGDFAGEDPSHNPTWSTWIYDLRLE